MSFTIRYQSDLHLEFSDGTMAMPEPADVLVLAGDIYTKGRMAWVNEAAYNFDDVVMVCGNHEFYGGDLTATLEKLKNNAERNVHVLQNESVDIKGTMFHGCTLWTDFDKGNPLAMMNVPDQLNDYRRIRSHNYTKRLKAQTIATEHSVSRIFLRETVKPGDVVVTHHAPSFQSISEQFKTDGLNVAYYSNMDYEVIDMAPALWFHGHVHHTNDYMIEGTRVLTNPRGYDPGDKNPLFNLNAEIII